MAESKATSEVGYGRPPKQTRFSKMMCEGNLAGKSMRPYMSATKAFSQTPCLVELATQYVDHIMITTVRGNDECNGVTGILALL